MREKVIQGEAFDWNCPQHIPVRVEAENVQRARDERDARMAQPKAALAGKSASVLLG